MDAEEWILYVALPTVIVVLLAVIIISDHREAARWHAFRDAHHCRITGRADGELSSGFASNGQTVVVASSNREQWLCDDGISYWKDAE